jgi:NDP-sugar pyrophosphorylase family protein
MSSEPTNAVIVAGGRGTRLAPYTTVLPKPLMPMVDRPIIDVVIRQLEHAGLSRVTIAVGHLGGLIESWVRNDPGYGIDVEFLYEDEPLGTAGALRNVQGLDGTFIAMNGDVLTSLNVADLLATHRATGSVATIATNTRRIPIEYGVVETAGSAEAERVVGLDEKPVHTFRVSMGVYAFEPEAVDYIEPGEPIDFPTLLERIMADGKEVASHHHAGYWRDIGNRDDYEMAVADFGNEPETFLAPKAAGATA